MRDFNSGDIHGDVTVQDSSINNKYKLLIYCDNEELLAEEQHRRNILSKERGQKNRVTWKFLGFSGLMLMTAAVWFFFQDKMNIVSVLTGAAGVLIGFGTLQQADTPTSFEQRQIDALDEINILLRERGIR